MTMDISLGILVYMRKSRISTYAGIGDNKSRPPSSLFVQKLVLSTFSSDIKLLTYTFPFCQLKRFL